MMQKHIRERDVMVIAEKLGKHQALQMVAQTMLNSGMDAATVLKMTGLAENDLKQLCY